jgi:hypothetical protein
MVVASNHGVQAYFQAPIERDAIAPARVLPFVDKQHSCYCLEAVAKLAWSVPRRAVADRATQQ